MRGQNGPFHVQIPLLLGHLGHSREPLVSAGSRFPAEFTRDPAGRGSKRVKMGSWETHPGRPQNDPFPVEMTQIQPNGLQEGSESTKRPLFLRSFDPYFDPFLTRKGSKPLRFSVPWAPGGAQKGGSKLGSGARNRPK